MLRRLLAAGLISMSSSVVLAEPMQVSWTPLPALPDDGALAQIGRSGMCAGTSHESLIFAGGANFPAPGKTASRGGAKTYYDDVFILNGEAWSKSEDTIPVRADSFLSVQDGNRIICIGGQGFRPGAEKRENLTTVFTMEVTDGALTVEALPELPSASVLGAGGIVNGTLVTTTGMSIHGLDLSADGAAWEEITQIPGPKRSVYGGTISDGKLWIVGGRNKDGDAWSHYAETHSYDFGNGTWTQHADFPIPAGFVTVIDAGDGKLAAVGGVDEDYFLRIQSQVIPRNKQEKGSSEWNDLNTQVTWLFDHHPGFMSHVFEYDLSADAWTQIGWHPGSAPINRSPVKVDGGWALAGGEVSAGKRTPFIWKVSFDR